MGSSAIGHRVLRVDHDMPRRMIFPLRRCPGLVPIPEIDNDVVILVVERKRTIIGHVVLDPGQQQARFTPTSDVAVRNA